MRVVEYQRQRTSRESKERAEEAARERLQIAVCVRREHRQRVARAGRGMRYGRRKIMKDIRYISVLRVELITLLCLHVSR